MKTAISTLFIVVGIFKFAQGQSIFIEDEFVSSSGPASELIETPTYLTNNSISSVDFVWERIEYTMPVEWSAPFCDKNNCYAPFTTTASFKLTAGEKGLLKPIFTPNGVEGLGTLKVRIYSITSGITFDDTVTFQVTTDGFVGINNVSNDFAISIYPNVTSSRFTVASPSPIDCYSVLGTDGKIVLKQNNVKWWGNEMSIDISTLESGMYYVILYAGNNSSIFSKPIIKL